MPYNHVISRADAQSLMPEDVSREIIKGVPAKSIVMQLGTKLQNLPRKVRRMPVLNSLPTAYFVNPSDTGIKQTSKVDWTNIFIEAEELAVLVPIPESVLDDADYDIWGETRPLIEEAIGSAVDAAVLRGVNAPGTWPRNILQGAADTNHRISLATKGDLYDAIFSENGVMDVVEKNGFVVSGHVCAPGMKAKLRGLRDSEGSLIFATSMQAAQTYNLGGEPCHFPANGCFSAADALDICGDWKNLVYAMRQDLTYKVLTEAVITDSNNQIIYNLAQQDMVALRVVIRLGWQLPNPPSRIEPDAGKRYPFGVLVA